jgi:hypothetical protein
MQISNFDKATVKALRIAMNNALASVESEYGIKINAGNASFSGNEVTFKVKANTVGDSGEAQTKEATQWTMMASVNGLGHLSVGDEVILQGKSFTISGWNTRARKSPIEITDTNGRSYKCSINMLSSYRK